MVDTTYSPKVYRELGGDRQVVASGGSLDVESGGEIDIESGASLKLAGTAIDATAAEINAAADISAGAAVAANGDTLTATAALHAGKVVQFGKTTGTVVTLPAATGTGHKYTFVIGVAATSNANIIKVANATDVMAGSVALQQDVDSAGTLKMWQAAATDDTITLAGAATTGGIKGGRIELVDYAAGFWSAQVFISSGGGAEATPFSATVS